MTTVLQSTALSLRDVEQRFNLQYVEDPNFFSEYQVSAPTFPELDQQILDRAKQDFLNLRKDSAKDWSLDKRHQDATLKKAS